MAQCLRVNIALQQICYQFPAPIRVVASTWNYDSRGIKNLWPPEHMYTYSLSLKSIFFSFLSSLLCCLDLQLPVNKSSRVSLVQNNGFHCDIILYIHNILWSPLVPFSSPGSPNTLEKACDDLWSLPIDMMISSSAHFLQTWAHCFLWLDNACVKPFFICQ